MEYGSHPKWRLVEVRMGRARGEHLGSRGDGIREEPGRVEREKEREREREREILGDTERE